MAAKYAKAVNSIVKGILQEGGEVRFTVTSRSMEPTMKAGDAVFIKKVPTEDLQEGDIIAFQADDVTFTHRIVEKREIDGNIGFVTKGDNVERADFPIRAEQVLGKVVRIDPSNCDRG